MVHHVERLPAELQPYVFADLEILDRGDIPLVEAGSDQHIAAAVAEATWIMRSGCGHSALTEAGIQPALWIDNPPVADNDIPRLGVKPATNQK